MKPPARACLCGGAPLQALNQGRSPLARAIACSRQPRLILGTSGCLASRLPGSSKPVSAAPLKPPVLELARCRAALPLPPVLDSRDIERREAFEAAMQRLPRRSCRDADWSVCFWLRRRAARPGSPLPFPRLEGRGARLGGQAGGSGEGGWIPEKRQRSPLKPDSYLD